MTNLWVQAMAWSEDRMGGRDKTRYTPIHVKQAGFAGVVGDHEDDKEMADQTGEAKPEEEFDEDLWDESTPEPTSHEQRHYEEHGEYPEEHFERHDQAFGEALERKRQDALKSPYDHEDPELRHFIGEHGSNTKLWHDYGRSGKINLRQPVYATQTHVAREHIDKYLKNRNATSHHQQIFGAHVGADYLGNEHPMFVTHQGRLHAIEGHHRVAAALERGDTGMHGHHFNLDEHPQFGNGEMNEEDYD
jgi:hypothetical protein